ncbi:hypothetical protein IFR05_016087 [Cadophora sp. M221]|nr:hypothetical protein IFR05_016087 [Cadophora sp. M221]
MVFHSLTLLALLPLLAAQSYPVNPLPTSTMVEDPAPTYIVDPPPSYIPDPIPSYTPIPQPEPEPTYTTVTYDEPVPSSTIGEDLPIMTYPACVPGEGECPYPPVSSTMVPESECVPDSTRECPPPVGPTSTPVPYPTSNIPVIIVGSTDLPLPSPTITSTSTNFCVCFKAPCTPCNGTPIPYPQTIYTTIIHTITSCSPFITSCPLGQKTTSTISLSTIPHPSLEPVYTTIYTTAYIDICPTGITTKTYTLTRTYTLEAYHVTEVPDHFTTTEKVCDACAGKPTVTVTCPVESETGIWVNGTTPAGPAAGCPGGEAYPGEKRKPAVCEGHGCLMGGSESAAGGVAKPTGSGSGSGMGCPYGESCPPGGNGTSGGGPYVTAGAAERVLVGGVKVLVVGGFVGVVVLML